MTESSKKVRPTVRQVKAARMLLGLTQAQLAELAGVTTRTIENFEAESREPYDSTLDAIQRALEEEGIGFTNNGGECVCLKRPSKVSTRESVLH